MFVFLWSTIAQERERVVNKAICDAIRSRAIIQFHYDGGLRIAEPHSHGISTAGSEVLRGYQTGGYSSSGDPVGWKLYLVASISGLRQTGKVFLANRPDYNPNDRGMISVHCHV